jgi:hypothetical protein
VNPPISQLPSDVVDVEYVVKVNVQWRDEDGGAHEALQALHNLLPTLGFVGRCLEDLKGQWLESAQDVGEQHRICCQCGYASARLVVVQILDSGRAQEEEEEFDGDTGGQELVNLGCFLQSNHPEADLRQA